MRKFIRFLIGLMACAVLAYSGYELFLFFSDVTASDKLNKSMINELVTLREAAPQADAVRAEATEESVPEDGTEPLEEAPIVVDFIKLREQSQNVVGWLYCEDTPINLPLAQYADNDYYLRRLLDGTGNNAGTLFMDYRNSWDFSDRNTVIYGHNMKNKTMFGSIGDYREQAYFESHPVMWLLTDHGNYKVELVAGFVTPSTSNAYVNPHTDEEMLDLARESVKKSTFVSDFQLNEGDRFLTLSTCSYEYDNARYVLVGRLVPAR